LPCTGALQLIIWHSAERLIFMKDTSCNELVSRYTIVERYHRHILWVILAFLFALDIFTTTVSLHQGNLERNPFMIPFVNNPLVHGIVKICAYILLFTIFEKAVLFIQEKQPGKKPFWIKLNFQALYGLIIFALIYLIWLYFYVLVNNILIIS
jgi:hypothetical protein